MRPLWQLNGQFFGWIGENKRLYNKLGRNVGHFDSGDFFYSAGQYLGTLYDDNRIAVQNAKILTVYQCRKSC